MVTNKGSDRVFNIVIYVVMTLFCVILLLPLLHVVACAFSEPKMVYTGKVIIFPKNLSVESFRRVFEEKSIWTGYRNTIFYTVVGTVISLFLQMSSGYALSRSDLRFRKLFQFMFVLTMFVSGGLIPSYIVIRTLKMLNTVWAIILPGALSAGNVIVVRTFISSSIPYDIQESAMIDGCSAGRIFFSIIIPLAKPLMAVMMLYSIVGYWNSYFNALIYVTNKDLQPLQMVLRNILVSNDINSMGGNTMGNAEAALMSESLKYSTIVVSTLPILIIYPFFEKYFEKGMIIGSLKG